MIEPNFSNRGSGKSSPPARTSRIRVFVGCRVRPLSVVSDPLASVISRPGWFLDEIFEAEGGLGSARLDFGGRGHFGGADHLGDQLVDGDVPLHLADRDDGGLLAGVELDDPAGPVVAEAGDDDAVAGLEPGAGLDQAGVVLGLALEVGEALVERLAAPLGLGLGRQGRLAGVLGVLAELLDDLQLGDVLAPRLLQVVSRPGRRGARRGSAAGRSASAFDWPMSPMCSR